MNPKNPFLIEGYHSPDYFCDRKHETAALVSALEFVRAFASGVFSAYESTLEKMTSASSKFLIGFRPTLAIDAFGTRKYSFDIVPSFANLRCSSM